jgi:hypothetical protein
MVPRRIGGLLGTRQERYEEYADTCILVYVSVYNFLTFLLTDMVLQLRRLC